MGTWPSGAGAWPCASQLRVPCVVQPAERAETQASPTSWARPPVGSAPAVPLWRGRPLVKRPDLLAADLQALWLSEVDRGNRAGRKRQPTGWFQSVRSTEVTDSAWTPRGAAPAGPTAGASSPAHLPKCPSPPRSLLLPKPQPGERRGTWQLLPPPVPAEVTAGRRSSFSAHGA